MRVPLNPSRTSAPHVLISADAVGGVWQYSLDLAAGLVGRGLTVTVAILGPAPSGARIAAAEGATGARIVATGLPLDWTAETPEAVLDAARALAELARSIGADLVHLHSPALALADYPLPVAAVCHSCVATWWDAVETGPLPPDLAWRHDLTARGCRAADALLAPTRAHALATARVCGLVQPPAVVRNGRSLSGLPPRALAPHAFTAGRLWDRAKNAAALDRLAGRLSAPLRAAGSVEGPNGARVETRHLHRLGRLDEVGIAAELAGRPVFVSLARYEPFGLAVLEAAAAGCALVLSDIPSFRELWDGAAAFVGANDDEAAAEAVQRLLDDPAWREAAGQAAAQRAARYGTEAMTEGVLGVLHGLLAGAPARLGGAAA
ncbi:Glycosyltransferase involved in cell wall bisynthesis [Methylobacterium phyllostachyos]|uniref:Glycosyltransferase involved in cell wall bisynthesis n=1 Tax=Methylobacterium phyllostachyos TaxID=582672 RepID=A0A1H0DIT3_9HYPH|nr:glycosyltransferase family 4 protein [Methylobacterium phyllostachyos]SDN69921.1 Glycosyltransferase involved in cell wall bisynthesis [Methylobacterium phyllostachyos]